MEEDCGCTDVDVVVTDEIVEGGREDGTVEEDVRSTDEDDMRAIGGAATAAPPRPTPASYTEREAAARAAKRCLDAMVEMVV